MRLTLPLRPFFVVILLARNHEVFAEPFRFPLPNGFPFPNETALEELFTRAGGNFSNAPLAPRFDDDSLTSWKLQAFNEFMEVAFFTQLIANISDGVAGYELDPSMREHVLTSLEVIQAQEEMHAYNANDAVRYFTNGSHMYPCTYEFPVSTFAEAVDFAQIMTDMYIGLLANIQQRTAMHLGSDAHPIIYVLAQGLGQEGQQSGWFRSLRGIPPSAEPFLTTSTREFALGWMQQWIVPGSCPNMHDIPLRIPSALGITAVSIGDESHSGNVTLLAPGAVDPSSQSVAFVNGALVPTIVPFEIRQTSPCHDDDQAFRDLRAVKAVKRNLGNRWSRDSQTVLVPGGPEGVGACIGSTEILAELPYAHNVMHGLIVMAVVKNDENGGDEAGFITAQDVADATIYGPALLEWS